MNSAMPRKPHLPQDLSGRFESWPKFLVPSARSSRNAALRYMLLYSAPCAFGRTVTNIQCIPEVESRKYAIIIWPGGSLQERNEDCLVFSLPTADSPISHICFFMTTHASRPLGYSHVSENGFLSFASGLSEPHALTARFRPDDLLLLLSRARTANVQSASCSLVDRYSLFVPGMFSRCSGLARSHTKSAVPCARLCREFVCAYALS